MADIIKRLEFIPYEYTEEENYNLASTNFNRIMQMYNDETISKEEAMLRGVMQLKQFFDVNHTMFNKPPLNFTDFMNIITSSQAASYLKTKDKNFLIGCVINGLITFGLSANKARKFICDVLGISDSLAKDARRLFQKTEPDIEDKRLFVTEYCFWVMDFCKENENLEHNKYPEYKELIEACNLEKTSIEKNDTYMYRPRPYEAS